MLIHKQTPAALPLPRLVSIWRRRITQAQRSADVWQELLSVRELLIAPKDDVKTWLKYSNLCRKSGRRELGHEIIVSRILKCEGGGSSPFSPTAEPLAEPLPAMEQPLVAYTYIKQLWAVGRVADAIDKLCLFVNDPRVAVDATLAAKAWRRLGEWQRA